MHASRRQGVGARLTELLWPSMGWKALGKLFMLKLRREAANPHKVALGVAIGVGISFLPFPGLGVVSAALLAWILRASIAAAVIGQFVGNPWTFPFIWWMTYGLGRAIWPGDPDFNWGAMMNQMSWEFMGDHVALLAHNVVIPLLIGGGVLGGIAGVLTYAAMYWEMVKFDEKKKARKRG